MTVDALSDFLGLSTSVAYRYMRVLRDAQIIEVDDCRNAVTGSRSKAVYPLSKDSKYLRVFEEEDRASGEIASDNGAELMGEARVDRFSVEGSVCEWVKTGNPKFSIRGESGVGKEDAAHMPGWASAQSLSAYMHECEHRDIEQVLAFNSGRIGESASMLGISRKNLWERMRRLSLRAERSSAPAEQASALKIASRLIK